MLILRLLMKMQLNKFIKIVFLIFLFSCNNTDRTNDLWNEAQNYYNLNNHDDCMVILHKIINNYPKSDKVLVLLLLVIETCLNIG